MKLLWLLLLASLACKLVLGKWPWDYLKGPNARAQQTLRARRLLGLPDRTSRDEIIEAHKRLIAVVHPDRGGTNDQVHEANAARDLLLEEVQG